MKIKCIVKHNAVHQSLIVMHEHSIIYALAFNFKRGLWESSSCPVSYCPIYRLVTPETFLSLLTLNLFFVKTCNMEYLGHIKRKENKYTLLQSIIQGKIHGKRGP